MTNQEPIFNSAHVPLNVAANQLGIDKQTLRLMLQQGLVTFGQAFKLPGSKKYKYIIFSRLF